MMNFVTISLGLLTFLYNNILFFIFLLFKSDLFLIGG